MITLGLIVDQHYIILVILVSLSFLGKNFVLVQLEK